MGSGTVPQRFTLRGALDCFLDFRFDTIRRRSAFQLRKVTSRAHIVDGLLAALTCVDEVKSPRVTFASVCTGIS
jgi:DNA gyrase subunit A